MRFSVSVLLGCGGGESVGGTSGFGSDVWPTPMAVDCFCFSAGAGGVVSVSSNT